MAGRPRTLPPGRSRTAPPAKPRTAPPRRRTAPPGRPRSVPPGRAARPVPKPRVRVKVCGLTCAEDARVALEAGADALGFVFHPGSPRAIDLETWLRIKPELPPWAYPVAVFTVAELPQLAEIVTLGGFPAYQIHGRPGHGGVPELPGRVVWRAFDPEQDEIGEAILWARGGSNRAVLLDPRRGAKLGGTGLPLELGPARLWLGALPQAVLAGGIGPENVAEVVARLGPVGVDASSRLEATPGRKDHEKVRAYVRRAKEVP